MKLIIFFGLSLFLSNSFCNDTMRRDLDIAWKNEKFANELITKLETKAIKEHQGYLAVAYMMKSNHANLPWTKLNYFYKGKKLLEKAIKEEPERVELRFFRYEIQVKIPKGLRYNNIEEDKKMLLAYISNNQNKAKDLHLFQKIIQLNLVKE